MHANELEIVISSLMFKAFELKIINIYFDWSFVCKSQCCNEGMDRKISSFQQNWRRLNCRKVEVIKLMYLVKILLYLNLDDGMDVDLSLKYTHMYIIGKRTRESLSFQI